jgi:predicted small lipoprotein YifL
MNRRHYLLTVALSLAAGLAGHALYGPLAAPTAARAAAEPRRDAQYEYCAVVKSQAIPTPRLFYWIVYFKDEGTAKTETIEASLSGNSQAKAIAKLGEDGWEMVGEGPLDVRADPRPGAAASAPTALFFKRRKD